MMRGELRWQDAGGHRRRGMSVTEMLMAAAIVVIVVGLSGFYYWNHVAESKRESARLIVWKLTRAAEAYRAKHGEFPPRLVSLTEREPERKEPYVGIDELKTPWGSEYHYDASGPNHNGSKPDVWADSPDGRIGNW